MVGQPGKAIVVDRNRTQARRLSRVLSSAGFRVEIAESYDKSGLPEPERLRLREGGGTVLLCGEAAAQEAILATLLALPNSADAGAPRSSAVLYGAADELSGTELSAAPGLTALLGSGTAGPRDLEAELLAVARHLLGVPLPPLQAHLLWGAPAYGAEIGNVAGREAAVQRIVELCHELNTSRRVADSAGEVVHEIITNALYDAPVDEQGKPRYAHDRTLPVSLPAKDRLSFHYGTDGLRLAVEAIDPFGRLSRNDLMSSLRRGASGEINQARGGAGIGLSLVYRASQTLQIDVEPRVRTRVTAVLDLEPPRPQEGAPRPGRSLIFSCGKAAATESGQAP